MGEIPQFKRINSPNYTESLEFDPCGDFTLEQFLSIVKDGTYVEIPSGNYVVNVVITKTLYLKASGQVTLRGSDNNDIIKASSNHLVLDGFAFDQKGNQGNCICVNSGYTRAIGCTFQGSENSPVFVTNNASLELINSAVISLSNPPLFLDKFAKCFCERCVLKDSNTHGAIIKADATLYMSKCNIGTNKVNGIHIQDR